MAPRKGERSYRHWSNNETRLLMLLRDYYSWPFHRIAVRLARSASECKSKHKNMQFNKQHGPTKLVYSRDQKCPDEALAERERRNEARLRMDLTASAFGDPPPGFSALDRRTTAA